MPILAAVDAALGLTAREHAEKVLGLDTLRLTDTLVPTSEASIIPAAVRALAGAADFAAALACPGQDR